jgi:hypothetical protein
MPVEMLYSWEKRQRLDYRMKASNASHHGHEFTSVPVHEIVGPFLILFLLINILSIILFSQKPDNRQTANF